MIAGVRPNGIICQYTTSRRQSQAFTMRYAVNLRWLPGVIGLSGGGTRFTKLDTVVKAETGKLLVFSNVLANFLLGNKLHQSTKWYRQLLQLVHSFFEVCQGSKFCQYRRVPKYKLLDNVIFSSLQFCLYLQVVIFFFQLMLFSTALCVQLLLSHQTNQKRFFAALILELVISSKYFRICWLTL